jgi:hypothetical protein
LTYSASRRLRRCAGMSRGWEREAVFVFARHLIHLSNRMPLREIRSMAHWRRWRAAGGVERP